MKGLTHTAHSGSLATDFFIGTHASTHWHADKHSFNIILELDLQLSSRSRRVHDGRRWTISDRELRKEVLTAVDKALEFAKKWGVEPVKQILIFYLGDNLATWKDGKIYLVGENIPDD